MELQTIINIVFAIIAGSSVALKYIAPLTENKIDDKIQKKLVKILKIFSQDSKYKD